MYDTPFIKTRNFIKSQFECRWLNPPTLNTHHTLFPPPSTAPRQLLATRGVVSACQCQSARRSHSSSDPNTRRLNLRRVRCTPVRPPSSITNASQGPSLRESMYHWSVRYIKKGITNRKREHLSNEPGVSCTGGVLGLFSLKDDGVGCRIKGRD